MLGSRLTLTYLTFWLTYQSSAKVYEPCALYNELLQKHGQTEEVAAQLVLLAERTGYNTEYNFIETEDVPELKLGIFGLKSHQVCSFSNIGGACNSNCRKFMDTDIRDDISCARKVMDKMHAKLTLFGKRRYHQCTECSFCPLRKPVECQERSFNPFNPQKDVIVASFQHTALLGSKNRLTNRLTVECTGSLITEDTILITASCMHKTLDLVYLGDLKLHDSDVHNRDLQFIEISSMIPHPNYNYNGVALIKLKRKAKLTETVMTACIWMGPKTLPQNLTTLNIQGTNQLQLGSVSQLDLKLGCCNMFPFVVGTDLVNFSDYIEWIQKYCPELPRSNIECASNAKEIDDVIYGPSKRENGGNRQGNVFGEEFSGKHVIGVAISDRFVLTSAQMLRKLSKPDRVHLGEAYFLETIIYHPGFNKQKPAKDDLVLIKLKDRIEGLTFDPFCVTSNPMDTGGAFIVDATLYDNSLLQLQYQDYGSDLSVCRQIYSKEFNFDDINPDNILCFDIAMIYVPGSCSIAIGSPIYTELGEMNFKNLKGFVLYNKDCGPIIATKVVSYTGWINQIVMSG